MAWFRKFIGEVKDEWNRQKEQEESLEKARNIAHWVYSGQAQKDLDELHKHIKDETEKVENIRKWIAEQRKYIQEQIVEQKELREQGIDIDKIKEEKQNDDEEN